MYNISTFVRSLVDWYYNFYAAINWLLRVLYIDKTTVCMKSWAVIGLNFFEFACA